MALWQLNCRPVLKLETNKTYAAPNDPLTRSFCVPAMRRKDVGLIVVPVAIPIAMVVVIAVAPIVRVAVLFVLAVMIAVVVVVLILAIMIAIVAPVLGSFVIAMEAPFPTAMPVPIRTSATQGERSAVTEVRIVVAIDPAAEAYRPGKPRAGAYEYTR